MTPKQQVMFHSCDEHPIEDHYTEFAKSSSTFPSYNTSSRTRKFLVIAALIVYGQAVSICCSIRYGFLADAFSSRGVPGKVYGLVESSIFLGYAIAFFSGKTEWLMMRYSSKTLLAWYTVGYAIISIATGYIYHLQNTMVVIVCSFVFRVVGGLLAYPTYLIPIDYISAQMPKEFDFFVGILNMGFFSGHGMAEVLGCVLYDNFGYATAYNFTAFYALFASALVALILPKTKTYLASQEKDKEPISAKKQTKDRRNTVTPWLVVPLVATMLINCNYGVLQVIVTPYLHSNFGKSISYGGIVLTSVSLGMAAGAVIGGGILQKRYLHHFTVMALGALLVGCGLLITFPPQAIPALYNIAPYLAFPGVFLAGLGDPIITIATLRALFSVQLQKRGVLTPKTTTTITGIWLMGYCGMYYSGSFIGGAMTDVLSYDATAQILSGICMMAVMFCVLLRLKFTKTNTDEETGEAVPLLQNEQ